MRNKKIVVVGGGTGNHTTLTGLRSCDCDVTAVVAMTDSGGSSGRLRDELGHLPPGDLRRCLMALASDSAESNLMRRLFDYRFSTGDGLNGHSFGNLLLAALTEVTGDTITAIDEAARILGIKGAVLPVTLTRSTLRARLVDGSELIGESAIDLRNDKLDVVIDYIYLDPKAYVYPPVLDAIAEADAIVLGPGDIYTSVLPNLLVEDVAQAINDSDAIKVHVCNLMTKPNESDGFRTSDFLALLMEYLGTSQPLDFLLVNSTPVPPRLMERYAAEGQHPVTVDEPASLTMVGRIVDRPLLAPGVFIRHNPSALAAAIMELVDSSERGRQDTKRPSLVFDCDDVGDVLMPEETMTVGSANADGD
ncbi:MAG: YvcK family protein [Chloroflexota bacterium]|nr:YvcK family protein [Chloroflexota bacterium]MDE2961618.1 YvcK family protein [Chloroflexota bacterium]